MPVIPPVSTATVRYVSGNAVEGSFALVEGNEGAASANAAALQALLDSDASQVSINKPGTYYCEQLVIPSDMTVVIGSGVTLKKPASYNISLMINSGALEETPARNENIRIIGEGTIDGNGANQVSVTQAVPGSIANDTFLYGIWGDVAMIQVDNFEFAVRHIYDLLGFTVQWIGVGAYIHDVTDVNTRSDFLHINGPSSRLRIERVAGYSTDDFIALNAWDWRRSSPMVGDITDVSIRDATYLGSNFNGRCGSFVKFLSGTRSAGYGQGTGNVRNVKVDGYHCDMSDGSETPANTAFNFFADYDQVIPGWAGEGTVENIEVSNGKCVVPNSNCLFAHVWKYTAGGTPADGQNTLTIRDVTFAKGHVDCSPSNATVGIRMDMAYTTCNVQGFTFRDMEWTPPQGRSDDLAFVRFANKTAGDSLEIDGLTINPTTSTGNVSAISVGQYSSGNAATLNNLLLSRIRTASGLQLPGAWLNLNGGVIKYLAVDGCHITGPAGGSNSQGIIVQSATSQLDFAKITNSHFDGVKSLLYLSNAGATVKLVIEGTKFLNGAHPIHINGAFSADVSFRGCEIDTGTNLARIVTGSAILSYEDTVSSGAGASTVTLSSGSVRLRNTDRIAFSPAVVQTPANNDIVNFSDTPSYTGVNVVSGTGAGRYIYRGTGTEGWIKLN